MLDADSTIYALSTAPGRAAIAVVRVSGPASTSVWTPANIYLDNAQALVADYYPAVDIQSTLSPSSIA